MWRIAYILVLLHIRSITCSDHVMTGCWPNNVIPFKIGRGFTPAEVKFIHDRIGEFNSLSCVRWLNVQNDEMAATEYVGFERSVNKYECSTVTVAVSDGTRELYIELGKSCFTRQVLMHEMMHVLGFPHEQQRSDRDCYVTIDYEEIDKLGKTHRFATKHIQWLEDFPYDKSSIMHYPRTTVMKARTERWYYSEPLGNQEGEVSFFDLWKMKYRFCGLPHYCDVFPDICVIMDELEESCAKQQPHISLLP